MFAHNINTKDIVTTFSTEYLFICKIPWHIGKCGMNTGKNKKQVRCAETQKKSHSTYIAYSSFIEPKRWLSNLKGVFSYINKDGGLQLL